MMHYDLFCESILLIGTCLDPRRALLYCQGILSPTHCVRLCSGFGELALLYSSPRAASVLAITDCKLWVMERTVYLAIKRTYQEQLAALKRKMVASVPILAVLSEVRLTPTSCVGACKVAEGLTALHLAAVMGHAASQ